MKISLTFRPKTLTLMRTWPGCGFGIGTCSISRTSGPPGWRMITAFIVAILDSGNDEIRCMIFGGGDLVVAKQR